MGDGYDREVLLTKAQCAYTSCYCEENIYKMCENFQSRAAGAVKQCDVVFISNDARVIPVWMQQRSENSESPMFWDYHVILIYRGSEPMVYDLDTRLPFPVPLSQYVKEGIRQDPQNPQYRRFFRVIPGEEYLRTFASDRSHMLDERGQYRRPPPPYPCITSPESTNNIQEFISMDPSVAHGRVLDLSGFLAHYTTG